MPGRAHAVNKVRAIANRRIDIPFPVEFETELQGSRSGIRQSGLPCVFQSGNLDLYLHTRIGKTGGNHHGRGANIAKILAEYRPTLRKVAAVRYDISDANHILQAGVRLLQCSLDVLQALFRLLGDAVRDRHGAVVKTRRARNKYPIANHDGAGITDLLFEGRA